MSVEVRMRFRLPARGEPRRSPTACSHGVPVTKRQTTHEARAGENMRMIRRDFPWSVPRPPVAAHTASRTKATPIATTTNKPIARQCTFLGVVMTAVISMRGRLRSGPSLSLPP